MNYEMTLRSILRCQKQKPLLLALISLSLLLMVAVASGQTPASSPNDSPSTSAPNSKTTVAPAAIPLGEIVSQAETTTASLNSIQANLDSDPVIQIGSDQLPALVREIDSHLDENARILDSHPSLDTLRTLELEWKTLAEKLQDLKSELTPRANALDREVEQLTLLDQTWSKTLAQTDNNQTTTADQSTGAETNPASSAPPEILQRVRSTIALIHQTRDAVEKRRTQILTIQSRLAEQDARVAEALSAVSKTRKEIVDRLFLRDSPPIWSGEIWSESGRSLLEESRNSLTEQWSALGIYVRQQYLRLVLHAVTLLLVIAAAYWTRRRVRPWVVAEPSLEGVARVFNAPIATALLLTILLSGLLYPRAPRLLAAILGAAALVPTVIILRQLLERTLFPILNALVGFYFIDQVRAISISVPVISRLLFLSEMLVGIMVVLWLIKSARLSKTPDAKPNRFSATVRTGAAIAGAVFVMALVANVLGYVSVAVLIGTGILRSVYIAFVLYAAIRIADGLIMFALRVRPLSLLGMVRSSRPLLRRRIQRVLRWIAALTWLLFTLELFSLRAPVIDTISRGLSASLHVGSLHLTLGNIVAFVITVWAAFLLSRFLRFLMEEDVYPRVHLARGIPYAISTMLHYVVLLVGFVFAVAALGIDMTQFTILAGAFGVGLGFGLQNIVNNFVSGLVLLFERPIKVNDVVQIGEYSGDLRHIGLRSSVLRTWEGSEVIVPNGELISNKVVNWTLSDQQRRLEINVGVAYGTEPELVIALLTKVATSHKDVMSDPRPQTLFCGFGESSLDFQLRAWTTHFNRWMVIKSELTVGVNAALRDAEISIPFPQRDLHIQTPTREVLSAGATK